MPSERLLQFIWQFQYFNTKELYTVTGESLQVLQQGMYNTNQGPDFLQAKIKIGNTTWAGNIEIHVKASDWHLHQHQTDEHYNNVILHVVWDNDATITSASGAIIPALELKPLIAKAMLQQYEKLMQSPDFVPCQSYLPMLSDIGWQNWQERLLIERLEKRSEQIFKYLKNSNNHWEEVLWWLLAKNFGIPVNAEAFEAVAQSISLSILAKHKNQIHQLEALLLGQAGFLQDSFSEEYPQLLQREYRFLKSKYYLVAANTKPVFLRMRPANFPTIRLAQLAMLISRSEHLFSKILEANQCTEIGALLNVTANDYWHYHYQLDVAADYKPKVLGTSMSDNVIINSIVPVLFAYGLYTGKQEHKDKAMEWLAQTTAEQNTVIKSWHQLGVHSKTALHTQGLLELKKEYCNMKRCLDCAVGTKILKQAL